MNLSLIDADKVVPQAWRNGGGSTRELLTWPASGDWQLRISRADIGADGPFSAFDGVQRWFAVLQGHGVALRFADREHGLRVGDAPLCFDGALAPGCRLVDGPTTDLNLMARGGSGWMEPALADAPWHSSLPLRGLYSSGAGLWRGGATQMNIPANTLLWIADALPGAWTFTPATTTAPCVALWLAFAPLPENTAP